MLSEKMSAKGMTDGVSSERCLPDRDSAFLEILLEFRDADDFEMEDRSRKEDRGACLGGIISEKMSLTEFVRPLSMK